MEFKFLSLSIRTRILIAIVLILSLIIYLKFTADPLTMQCSGNNYTIEKEYQFICNDTVLVKKEYMSYYIINTKSKVDFALHIQSTVREDLKEEQGNKT